MGRRRLPGEKLVTLENMMTAAQCQELANHYKSLSQLPGISTDRAFILKNIARSLVGLASQLDRLAVLMRNEAK
jgi:hypothetical protein